MVTIQHHFTCKARAATLQACMNIVVSDLAQLVVVWGRIVAYKGEVLLDEMWRGVEVVTSGVKELLVDVL